MRIGRLRKSLALGALATVAVAAVLTHGRDARAQEGFSLNRFDPSPAGDLFFGVQRPTVDGDVRVNAAVIGDYANAPLVLRDRLNGNVEVGRIVSKQAFLHVAASLALFDRLLLSINLPIAMLNTGGNPRTAAGTTFTSPDGVAAGDLRIGARVRLLGEPDEPFQIALATSLYTPTGNRDSYAGDGKVRVAPSLVVGGIADDFLVWNVNAGVMLRRTNDVLGSKVGNELLFGAAIGVLAANKTFLIGPELYGSTEIVDGASAFSNKSTNAELLGTIKFRPSPFVIGFGAGPGFGAGLGTPDFRMVATLGYAPWGKDEPKAPTDTDGDGIFDRDDACVDVVGVKSDDPKKNGCPADKPDTDKDGIFDDVDACKDVAGTRSDDPKKNGCPPDKDGDGVVDAQDACIDVAGEKNEDPKKNGCPPDKDGDGIADTQDACIDVPGVKDADPKKNGCPPDSDGDGILDSNDACPNAAGPNDPDPKKNGCPLVTITAKSIDILEQVHFATGKATILGDSNALLEAVAKVFKDHPEIKKVSIEGHTDSKGAAPFNLVLSQQRAAAVVKWLVDHGVEKARLTSKGFGLTQPIGDNTTEEGREKNRRVEFRIVDPAPPTGP